MDKILQYQIAKSYYQDNRGQQEIAHIFGISRSQVSKILKEARETGMVHISIVTPVTASDKYLVEKLQKLLKIDNVKIVDSLSCSTENVQQRLDLVTTFSADYLLEKFKQVTNIGVGWGNTVYKTVYSIGYQGGDCPCCFVPLVGNTGLDEPCYQTNFIVERLSERCKGSRKFINVPAFLPDAATRKAMMESTSMSEIISDWHSLDLAFFSVGASLKSSETIMASIDDKKLLQAILSKDPVGDLLGNYFNKHGEFCLSDGSGCITIPIHTFLKIPQRICIAIGTDKVPVILAAAKLKAYTELVTDTYTALDLIKAE